VQCSEIWRLAGHGEEAGQHAHQALDLARQHKAGGDEALALHQLGVVHTHANPPDAKQAETYYQQALAWPWQCACSGRIATRVSASFTLRPASDSRPEQNCPQPSRCMRAMDMTFWLPQAEAALAQIGEAERPAGGVP
jgi:hypothetical protein